MSKPIVHFWSPDQATNPTGYETMQILKAHAHAIVDLLQSQGVTQADVMPPLKRGNYVPDEEIQYEIFAHPHTLKLLNEGQKVSEGIEDMTGLFGVMGPPLAQRELHIGTHALSSIYKSHAEEISR